MNITEKIDKYLNEEWKITVKKDISKAKKLLSKEKIKFKIEDDDIVFGTEKQMTNAIMSLEDEGIKFKV